MSQSRKIFWVGFSVLVWVFVAAGLPQFRHLFPLMVRVQPIAIGVAVLWSLYLFAGPIWREFLANAKSWLLFLSVAGVAVLIVCLHVPGIFRVLGDEVLHLAASVSVWKNHTLSIPSGYFWGPPYENTIGDAAPSRPGLFAVVIALVHFARGYRAENVFIANAFLSLGLLGLVFWAGWRWTGSRIAGWVTSLLLFSYPLTLIVMRSAGYEMVNACFIFAAILVLAEYFTEPSEEKLVRFISISVICLFCRYESIFVGLPVFFLGGREFWKTGSKRILGSLLFYSILAVPIVWQRFMVGAGGIQPPPGLPMFSVRYVFQNIWDMIRFFAAQDSTLPNSRLIFVIMLASLFFAVRTKLYERRETVDQALLKAATLILSPIAVVFGLYFSGTILPPDCNRYLFVALPCFFMMTVVSLAKFQNSRIVWLGVLYCAPVFILISLRTAIHVNEFGKRPTSRRYMMQSQVLKQLAKSQKSLLVSDQSWAFGLLGFSSVSTAHLQNNASWVRAEMKTRGLNRMIWLDYRESSRKAEERSVSAHEWFKRHGFSVRLIYDFYGPNRRPPIRLFELTDASLSESTRSNSG